MKGQVAQEARDLAQMPSTSTASRSSADTMPARRSSRDPTYREYYDDQTRELIGARYHDEIDRFGYSF